MLELIFPKYPALLARIKQVKNEIVAEWKQEIKTMQSVLMGRILLFLIITSSIIFIPYLAGKAVVNLPMIHATGAIHFIEIWLLGFFSLVAGVVFGWMAFWVIIGVTCFCLMILGFILILFLNMLLWLIYGDPII